MTMGFGIIHRIAVLEGAAIQVKRCMAEINAAHLLRVRILRPNFTTANTVCDGQLAALRHLNDAVFHTGIDINDMSVQAQIDLRIQCLGLVQTHLIRQVIVSGLTGQRIAVFPRCPCNALMAGVVSHTCAAAAHAVAVLIRRQRARGQHCHQHTQQQQPPADPFFHSISSSVSLSRTQ